MPFEVLRSVVAWQDLGWAWTGGWKNDKVRCTRQYGVYLTAHSCALYRAFTCTGAYSCMTWYAGALDLAYFNFICSHSIWCTAVSRTCDAGDSISWGKGCTLTFEAWNRDRFAIFLTISLICVIKLMYCYRFLPVVAGYHSTPNFTTCIIFFFII